MSVERTAPLVEAEGVSRARLLVAMSFVVAVQLQWSGPIADIARGEGSVGSVLLAFFWLFIDIFAAGGLLKSLTTEQPMSRRERELRVLRWGWAIGVAMIALGVWFRAMATIDSRPLALEHGSLLVAEIWLGLLLIGLTPWAHRRTRELGVHDQG